VRNLAQRSADAAREIKMLIKDSLEKVEQGTRLVGRSGDTLEEIVSRVAKVSDIVSEIAEASDEQAQGIEQVNLAVSQMDEATQHNRSLVEQATASSLALDTQTRTLRSLVQAMESPSTADLNVSAPTAMDDIVSPTLAADGPSIHDEDLWEEF